jgi:hypothetical protein
VITEEFEAAKKHEWWQFPIQTGTTYEGGKCFMVEHSFHGLAMSGREGEVAEFGGWHRTQAPKLCGTVKWVDGDKYFPADNQYLFVLKGRLIMN